MELRSLFRMIFNTLSLRNPPNGLNPMESPKKKSSKTESGGAANTTESSFLSSTFTVTYSFTNAADGQKRIFTQRGVPNWSILSVENSRDSVGARVIERSAPSRITSQQSKLLAMSLRCVCGEVHYLQVGFGDSLTTTAD